MCHLVEVFNPIDVYPCTVNEEKWNWNLSIRYLFGHLCSGDSFSHDNEMLTTHGHHSMLLMDKRIMEKWEKDMYDNHLLKDELWNQWVCVPGSTLKSQKASLIIRPIKLDRMSLRLNLESKCKKPSLRVHSFRTQLYPRRADTVKEFFEEWLHRVENDTDQVSQ